MARFFAPQECWQDGTVELPAAESRHAAQVLRLGVGDKIEVFDGAGRAARAELTEVSKNRAFAHIVSEERVARVESGIHLLVALIKGERFDWLVQKATELGAASIRPVAAARCVVRLDGKDAGKRRDKWVQTSVEAAKQCGHVVLPEILPVTSAVDAFRAAPEGLRGIPSLHPSGKLLKEFFAAAPVSNVTMAIGPEGDWTDEEIAAASAAGFVPLDLGSNVLRSETAALYVLSAAAHHFLGGVGGRNQRA
jgi:16S rRNA (uracil1498-N3)-methyltransferase